MNKQTERVDLKSMDIGKENRARLRQLFPAVFIETLNEKGELVESIDFEKLKASIEKCNVVIHLVGAPQGGTAQSEPEMSFKLNVESLQNVLEACRICGGKNLIFPSSAAIYGITEDLPEQTAIIEANMMEYIDGIECWHSRSDADTTKHYLHFCKKHNLMMTGGSDCHQKPLLLGTVTVPDFVAGQFKA